MIWKLTFINRSSYAGYASFPSNANIHMELSFHKDVPAASIDTAQLKDGAVTSAKIDSGVRMLPHYVSVVSATPTLNNNVSVLQLTTTVKNVCELTVTPKKSTSKYLVSLNFQVRGDTSSGSYSRAFLVQQNSSASDLTGDPSGAQQICPRVYTEFYDAPSSSTANKAFTVAMRAVYTFSSSSAKKFQFYCRENGSSLDGWIDNFFMDAVEVDD